MQEISTLLVSLSLFVLFINLQSWFINGIHTTAAGDTEKKPDGTDLDSEMILYPLRKELERSEKKRIYYTDPVQLSEVWTSLRERYGDALPGSLAHREDGWNTVSSVGLEAGYSDERSIKALEKDMKKMGLFVEWGSTDCGGRVRHFALYKIYEKFVYSKWLRKPIISCPACMASFWGTLTYWPATLCAFGFFWWQIPVWVFDVLALSYLNMFWKKLK